MISENMSNNNKTGARSILDGWCKLVLLKVSVLVQRIWKNNILTRDNLVKRGILVES